jgi:putative radical SAM enzyme (TIGR03279 family)
MSAPTVTALLEGSPAAAAGFQVGDELVSFNGEQPRDVIEYQQMVDAARLDVVVRRPGTELDRRIRVEKAAGEPLGLEVSAAVFDRVRTCDNHCAFCFIYQLPKGMRKSLYLKDDDYRLSFLYGNFTTLTRFTELDAERVITERLGPLFVSIHATDPTVRASMLRNPRGATSLRWLRVLHDAGIEVHGQVVVCPGVNDGAVLEDTMAGILDQYAELATVGVVPLGLSRFSTEADMRPHTTEEAQSVLATVTEYQELCRSAVGRRLVFASDEYFLMAGQPFPTADAYEGYPQHENGIGMVRAFGEALGGDAAAAQGVRPGFFAWVDGAPPEGYRAPRAVPS